MDVSLLIRLIDQATGPAKKIADSLRGIGDVASGLKEGFGQAIRQGFSAENIETATRNAEQALSRARGRLLGAVAMAMSVAAPVVEAGKFDQSMRGLDKVLDVTESRLSQLRKFALDTSAMVPIAARSLVELMAEAAQGGVPEEELEAFSLYVAKAAVAFDMAGAEIGERFAKLRNVYKLNQEGIEDLGDATNHLSNNMAAKASEVTDFTNRAAGAARTLNLTATQMAAVGTAMIAAGIVPETAARGLSALSNRIIAGGKKVDQAFKMIGMSRKQFQKDLAADGPAALEKLFNTMATDPKGMEALVNLVGQDFADDFAKFLGNPELLAQALELVADKSKYAGSATDEAAKQAAGAEKQWDLLRNKLDRLAINIGDKLLPVFFQVVDALGELLDKVSEWTDANPELAAGIAKGVAGFLAFSIASRVLAFALAAIRLPLIQLAASFLKFDRDGRNIAVGWRIMRGAAMALATPLHFLGGALLEITRHVPALRNAAVGFTMLASTARGGAIGATFTALASAIGAVGAALASITAPAWIVIAVLTAAGFAVWKFWDRISAFASGFGSVFADLFADIGARIANFADGFVKFNAALFGIDGAAVDRFKASIAAAFDFSEWIAAAKQALADFWNSIGSFFSAETLTEGEQAAMYQAGRDLAQRLVDGIVEFIKSAFGTIKGLLTFDLTINWPEPPEWLKWLVERSKAAGGAARDLVSSGAQAASDWWNGTEGTPGAGGKAESFAKDVSGGGASAPASGGGMLSDAWAGLKSAMGFAGDDLAAGGERGGQAVADGGREAAEAMKGAAAAIASASASIGAAVAKASSVAAPSGGTVARAITSVRTNTLSGGTD
ncbi:phage tail tape measure protein [Shinella sp.]|uniref:phage tail tape measure protein n=1 Tax=Shinella sp. TaxID=1870904 RepID=UPI0039E3DBE4